MILSFALSALLLGAHAEDVKPPMSAVEKLLSQQDEKIFEIGKGHYQKYCIACHASTNIMVASPKFADRNDWSARLMSAKSISGLVKNATNGKGAMPAKGLCKECKDKDLQAAILYMMRGQD
jgi:cytochrome c5